jgi:hypothetical protein
MYIDCSNRQDTDFANLERHMDIKYYMRTEKGLGESGEGPMCRLHVVSSYMLTTLRDIHLQYTYHHAGRCKKVIITVLDGFENRNSLPPWIQHTSSTESYWQARNTTININ